MSWEADQLPHGWRLARVSDVTVDVPNVDPSRAPDSPFTYVDIGSVDNRTFSITSPKHLLGRDAPSRAKRLIAEGDVVFSNVRTYLKNIAQVGPIDGQAVASTGFTILRPSKEVDSRYLFHLVRSNAFVDSVTPEQTGTHYPATSDRVVRGQTIPVPPLDTQVEIAKLLDGVETAATAARTNLSTAHLAIKRFRQAVLAAACSGRLTPDWQGSALNAADLASSRGTARRRGRRFEVEPDLELPELPDRYVVTTIGAVAEEIEYGTSQRADAGAADGVPVLRMGNIQDGELDLGDLKYCMMNWEVERLLLQDGDLLFNRTNSPELVGKSAVFRGVERMTFASYLIRVKLDSRFAVPEYVNYWLNSAWGRMWARHVKGDGVSQSNINGTKLAAMPLSLPALDEQREIVRLVSLHIGSANAMTSAIDSSNEQLDEAAAAALAGALAVS